jgi:competence protein ComEC
VAHKLQLDVLDVGQGTALLLQTGSGLLLYDSGPGDGAGNNLVASVIHPAVLASGYSRPDRIIISHADLDHAGGLASLQEHYPFVPVFASLPQPKPGIDPCDDSLSWSWQQSYFRVLHPSPYLPYQGNDSSCVLDVNAGQFKLLFTGDISSKVERRLLGRKLDVYRILLVPHHGSRSSSDPELLHVTVPELAIATAGVGNRFGFPRPEVKQRFADAGVNLLSTDQCGAIRLKMDGDGPIQLHSARRQRAAPWRWPAGQECP